jgi:Xaa-Pro aminopeptidase
VPAGAVDVALSYGFGGGIGLDPSEHPEVSTTSEATLAPGMVLALQAIVPEHGGLGCAAETVLVTEDGVAPL